MKFFFAVALVVLVSGCAIHVKHEHHFTGNIICRPIFGGYKCTVEDKGKQ